MVDLAFAQAWTALRRHSLVAIGAVANIAVSLSILGGFLLLASNLEHMASGLAQEAIITVQLKDDANAAQVEAKLYSDSRVKETKYISKEEGLKEYAQAVNLPYADLKSAITNPLPNIIRVKVSRPEDLPAVVLSARAIEGVEKVRYRKDVAEKLLQVAEGVKVMGLVLGGVMALAALLLVSTTIQLGVHARRREIRIMQLVGATNNFIRAPFMIEGGVEGMLGGILAAALLLGGYSYVYRHLTATLSFLDLIYSTQFLSAVAGGLALLGVVFGILGSLLGTRRYLRLV